MSLLYEFQKLNQPGFIDLYEIDLTPTGSSVKYFFVSDKETDGTDVSFRGQKYVALPIMIEGFEITSKAPFATPTMTVSNIMGTITSLMLLNQDFVGAKVTRRRTLVRYLDNHEQPLSEETTPEVYYIERPIEENELFCSFQLANAMDMEGVSLPKRVVTRRCRWKYRGENCGYTGTRYFTREDRETSDLRDDECSHTVTGCKLRFGSGELPYGGFPLIDP